MILKKILLMILILININSKNILINGSMEHGTILVIEILKKLTGYEAIFIESKDIFINDFDVDKIYYGHIPYGYDQSLILKKQNFKMIYIERDLRDVVVLNSIKFKNNPSLYPGLNGLNLSLNYIFLWRLKEIIELDHYYRLWLSNDLCRSIMFEKLIGSELFCSNNDQINEIKLLARCIDIEIDYQEAYACLDIINNEILSEKSDLYKTNIWPQYFNSSSKRIFKKVVGDLLIKLGYEASLKW
jgi:hypothetical protein